MWWRKPGLSSLKNYLADGVGCRRKGLDHRLRYKSYIFYRETGDYFLSPGVGKDL